jgi:hypothetical protein
MRESAAARPHLRSRLLRVINKETADSVDGYAACCNILSINRKLFLLVTILSKTLFALMGRHLMTFTFFSAWHTNRF